MRAKGFTLVELLVVIAIIAVLAASLFPVFAAAKTSGKRARCTAQLRQLVAATMAYTDDYSGRYVPAAEDMYCTNPSGGHCRWHGYRERSKEDFDPRKGPLWTYMSRSGGLKVCPSAPDLVTVASFLSAFESGCGGYGYNYRYVGGTYYRNYGEEAAALASTTGDIAHASQTVMFADTAMAMNDAREHRQILVEYSFAEPPYVCDLGLAQPIRTASPSIHFRHGGRVSVGWCDGHISAEKMSFTSPGTNTYGCDNKLFDIGWFGPDDNSLFDNK